jgi:transcriptional regulator with XRE-family HTH domain
VDALPAYTGRDLADYRRGHGLTQRAVAAMLGVEQGTVCKGERRPGAVLGPTLRAAFHRLVAGSPQGSGGT